MRIFNKLIELHELRAYEVKKRFDEIGSAGRVTDFTEYLKGKL